MEEEIEKLKKELYMLSNAFFSLKQEFKDLKLMLKKC
jgi:hypothetical protein